MNKCDTTYKKILEAVATLDADERIRIGISVASSALMEDKKEYCCLDINGQKYVLVIGDSAKQLDKISATINLEGETQ